jgi:hypothetical protein
MRTPRQFIEDIQVRQTKSDKEFILDSLTGAIDRLQKAFPRYGSFLMEFMQNADDADSESLKIEIGASIIEISNDGRVFSEEDVKSICKVGRSSKTPKDYIGYLGVGFKAAFLISDNPKIDSGNFSFKFDKNAWPDPSHTPWQVIPLWVEGTPSISPEYTTVFSLPVKDSTLLQKIRDEIKPEQLNERMLLFLRHIKEIEIADSGQNYNRKIVKSLLAETAEYQTYRIQEYQNELPVHQDDWVLFRDTKEVPPSVKQDYVTKDWERAEVETREVLVAFRLGEDGNIIVEKKGTAYIGVFSFLPLKEVPSGLNFLVQADLLTAPGRGELARECMWNNWLAGEIYNLIVNKCVPAFLKNDLWKMNFTEILYSHEGGHELFDQYIKRPLRTYLESSEVLIAEDGSVINSNHAFTIGQKVRNVLSNDDLISLYPTKKPVHEACTFGDLPNVVEAPQTVPDFVVSSEASKLMKQKAIQKDLDWFKKLYVALDSYDKTELARLRYASFILTSEYKLSHPAAVYVNPKEIEIPPEIASNFTIVHPNLVAEKSLESVFAKLEISEIAEKHVQDILREKEIPLMSKSWPSFSDLEKLEKLRICKELWKKKKISTRDLGFLSLKSKNGNWLDPKQILFSKEFTPTYDVESLVEKGLVDMKLEFLSPDFAGESDKNDWFNFFKELGVGNILEEPSSRSHIVQRIGIKLSLIYEQKNGRTPIELGESVKPGYDIESNLGTKIRHIEVKSNRDSSPDVFVTPKEFLRLQTDKECYFIYVVTDALKTPILHCISGYKVVEADFSISLPASLWKKLSEEEFRC